MSKNDEMDEMTEVIIRNPGMRCFSSAEEIGFLPTNNEDCLMIDGKEVPVAQKTWGITALPREKDSIIEKLLAFGFERNLCVDTIETMISQGILWKMEKQEAHDLLIPMQSAPICAHLLVCISGAVQAASIVTYLKTLKTHFCKEMKIIVTKNALKMLQPKALRHILDCEIFTDVFDDVIGVHHVPHVWLSDWAECILIAPASANTIHKIANATCDDMLSLAIACTTPDRPIVLVPSMNVRMWDNPGIQRNLDLLRKRPNYWIIEAGYGVEVNKNWDNRALMDGSFGAATPEELARALENIFEIVCEKDEKITF